VDIGGYDATLGLIPEVFKQADYPNGPPDDADGLPQPASASR
jgi:hypothetical protein